MVFSSLIFLYIFLPLCVILYFALPGMEKKNAVLIVFSLLFYAWGEPVYVVLLIAMAAVNWYFGMILGRQHKKLWLVLAIVLDLGCLAVFKYAGFIVENLNALLRLQIAVPKITLPIGISFYTFQALSYTIDVWRGRVRVQKSFWKFLLYVSLFPQLIAGPIVRYSDVEPQMDERKTNLSEIFYGVTRFCMGLAKKVLLADYAGKVANQILNGTFATTTTLSLWLGVLMYTFEIYFDFSGYSDMAIGLGHVFGFRYPENFRLPYIARSITDFWRRWHISLSSFFRDYVYIPLGGNRKHVYWNLAVVWTLTGLWHGASWNFVLWGFYFFVILSIERLFRDKIKKIPRPVQHVVTLLLIMIGWNIFYFTDFSRLTESFRVLFGFAGAGFSNEQTSILLLNNLPLAILCAIGCTPIPQAIGNSFGALCADKNRESGKQKTYVIVTYVYDLLLLALSTVALVGSSYNAFLYFRF
jgi:alginate O-acetyltransferase complex protein AlgI